MIPTFASWQPTHLQAPAAELREHLLNQGAVLLRQYSLSDFMTLTNRYGRDFITSASNQQSQQPQLAISGNSGRKCVQDCPSLFLATGSSLLKGLPLHGELYYQSLQPPELLWFYCVEADSPVSGTWICDGQRLFETLPSAIQDLLLQHTVVYTRTLTRDYWPKAYGTADFEALSAFLQPLGIQADIQPNGELQTRFSASPLRWSHNQPVFINNILPFGLREHEEPDSRARVRLDDGRAIPLQTLLTIQALADRIKHEHHWQAGDILLIDNRWMLHGRGPLSAGLRQLYLRMSGAGLLR